MSKGRVWLTGASSGIGACLAEKLAEQGGEVICFSRRTAAADSAAVKSIAVDLADPEAVRQAFAEAAASVPANRLVHNAGAIREKPLAAVTQQDMDALARLHLGAAVAMVQANLACMREAGWGRIVLVSSRAVVGLAKRTAYASTKAGMLGLARTWALELAPLKVTANAILPGPIAETEMFDDAVPPDSGRAARLAASIPAGRLGRPADVARAALFFLDRGNGYVTGQALYVCGGTSVGSLTL
ncbi:MAG: SDR family oxidoreductase [Gammaproteobacteria bacterium]|nr:SDR family oxidoreductase [Gammaproteobacteria bacterium]